MLAHAARSRSASSPAAACAFSASNACPACTTRTLSWVASSSVASTRASVAGIFSVLRPATSIATVPWGFSARAAQIGVQRQRPLRVHRRIQQLAHGRQRHAPQIDVRLDRHARDGRARGRVMKQAADRGLRLRRHVQRSGQRAATRAGGVQPQRDRPLALAVDRQIDVADRLLGDVQATRTQRDRDAWPSRAAVGVDRQRQPPAGGDRHRAAGDRLDRLGQRAEVRLRRLQRQPQRLGRISRRPGRGHIEVRVDPRPRGARDNISPQACRREPDVGVDVDLADGRHRGRHQRPRQAAQIEVRNREPRPPGAAHLAHIRTNSLPAPAQVEPRHLQPTVTRHHLGRAGQRPGLARVPQGQRVDPHRVGVQPPPVGRQRQRVGRRRAGVHRDVRPDDVQRDVQPRDAPLRELHGSRGHVQVDLLRVVDARQPRAELQVPHGVVLVRQVRHARGDLHLGVADDPLHRDVDRPGARQLQRRRQVAARQAARRRRQVGRVDAQLGIDVRAVGRGVPLHDQPRGARVQVQRGVAAVRVDVDRHAGLRRVAHEVGQVDVVHAQREAVLRRAQRPQVHAAARLDAGADGRDAQVCADVLRSRLVADVTVDGQRGDVNGRRAGAHADVRRRARPAGAGR